MREIKFRVWDTLNNRMIYEDNILNYSPSPFRATIKDTRFVRVDIMQYTGLHDKNGKEIYEGDIVRVGTWWLNDDEDLPKSIEEFEGTIHQVKWCGAYDYPAFDLHPNLNCDSNGLSEIFGSGEEKIEVIGNIYENLELLQKE